MAFHVLVVDDDADTRANLRDLLELDGYAVDAVGTAAEAVAPRDWAGYGAVVLDRRLPDGTAEDALPRLRQAAPDVAVLIVTGHADVHGAIAAFRLGAVDYILKPVDPAELRARLGRIADQRRTREELRAANDRLRVVLASITDGYFAVDPDGRFLDVNPVAEEALFGRPARDLVGKVLWDEFPDRADDGCCQAIRYARSTGRAVHFECRAAAADRWFEAHAYLRDGRVEVYLRDITERKRADEALRESQAFIRSVLDSLGAHVAVLDRSGAVLGVNAAWARFAREHRAGRNRPGVGANYLDACRRGGEEGQAVAGGIEAVLAGQTDLFTLEYPCDGPAGRAWFTLMVTPLGADRQGVVVAHHDVTDRRRAEEALRETSEARERALADLRAKTEELRATTQQLWQAARLAGVGELAASLAHELNNPLGTVSLRVEGVLAKTPAGDPRRRPLEIVEQEVERMARLVGNLLQFSRPGRDQVSLVDACEEVAKTVELTDHHLRRRRVRVDPEFAAGVPPVPADRQQLRQVLLNLFTNAADAMPDGGRLVPRVRPGALPDGRPAVAIEVADTGVGIPPEHLPWVAEPFFTTKEEGKGTGLGLAICRRIVQQHEGTLTVESEVGRGTTVRVLLPVRVDGDRAATRSA